MENGTSNSDPDADRYLPDFLAPYLPANPDARDAVMAFAGILLSTLLGIIALQFVHEWIGIAIVAIGIAHFKVRYASRANDRYKRRKRTKTDSK